VNFSLSFVADLAVIMAIAAVVTFIFHRLRQPIILGYLIAGIIIGPFTPPFSLISNIEVLGGVADLGVILLLFGVGLEFPLEKLRKIGFRIYIGISLIEIALMFVVSFGIGKILGWAYLDSLFLGAALSSSSTVIIAKVLKDLGKLKDVSTLVMMGVLIAEDVVVVAMLAVITSIAGIGASSSLFPDLVWNISKILLFIIGSLVIGILFVPRIIDRIAKPELGRDDQAEHDEVLLLVALGLCFGLSILSNSVGLSVAIGAFLMGIFVASAKSAGKVAMLTSSIKDMFAAIFFVSMGAFIDITQFRVFLIPGLIVTGMMVLGKVIGCGLGTKIFGYDKSTSLRVGLGMGQIGEFAFIVMRAGQDLNIISPFLFPTVATAVAITAFLTPYMIKLSYKLTPGESLLIEAP
jgi:CPA2 family monovalent cation:H+ antiporter-2